jgi:hypothetical protein
VLPAAAGAALLPQRQYQVLLAMRPRVPAQAALLLVAQQVPVLALLLLLLRVAAGVPCRVQQPLLLLLVATL